MTCTKGKDDSRIIGYKIKIKNLGHSYKSPENEEKYKGIKIV